VVFHMGNFGAAGKDMGEMRFPAGGIFAASPQPAHGRIVQNDAMRPCSRNAASRFCRQIGSSTRVTSPVSIVVTARSATAG